MTSAKRINKPVVDKRKRTLTRDQKDNIFYYAMMAIPLVLIFIFSYLPMGGLIIAFQDYSAGRPFLGEGVKWVGLKHFKKFVSSYYFTRIIRNTLFMNLLDLALGFWVPIAFAVMLNEVRNSKFRKITQTVSYMPNFISTVVVAGMYLSFIADDGIITMALNAIGFQVKSLNVNKELFPWAYTLLKVWKGFGWSSIIYLSTITSIPMELYEATEVDGATRLQRIWHVTIPQLLPLIMIQLIFAIGGILGEGGGTILLLYNSAVYETADVLDTFIYRKTLQGGQYSYGTAAGLFMSIIGTTMVVGANAISRKLTDYSIW